MRTRIALRLACCLLAVTACARPGDPYRSEGVNATVVPVHESARPGDEPEAWLFRATLPGGPAAAADHTDLPSPPDLIAFVGEQPQEVRDNGLWVLVNDETEPGPALKRMLRELVQLAERDDLPLFICRSSEFPHGYERVN